MISLSIEQVSNGWIVSIYRESAHPTNVVREAPARSVFESIPEIQEALPLLLADYFITPTAVSPSLPPETTSNPPPETT